MNQDREGGLIAQLQRSRGAHTWPKMPGCKIWGGEPMLHCSCRLHAELGRGGSPPKRMNL
jgi:hypothetical protein